MLALLLTMRKPCKDCGSYQSYERLWDSRQSDRQSDGLKRMRRRDVPHQSDRQRQTQRQTQRTQRGFENSDSFDFDFERVGPIPTPPVDAGSRQCNGGLGLGCGNWTPCALCTLSIQKLQETLPGWIDSIDNETLPTLWNVMMEELDNTSLRVVKTQRDREGVYVVYDDVGDLDDFRESWKPSRTLACDVSVSQSDVKLIRMPYGSDPDNELWVSALLGEGVPILPGIEHTGIGSDGFTWNTVTNESLLGTARRMAGYSTLVSNTSDTGNSTVWYPTGAIMQYDALDSLLLLRSLMCYGGDERTFLLNLDASATDSESKSSTVPPGTNRGLRALIGYVSEAGVNNTFLNAAGDSLVASFPAYRMVQSLLRKLPLLTRTPQSICESWTLCDSWQ